MTSPKPPAHVGSDDIRLTRVGVEEAEHLSAYCRQVYRQHYEYLWFDGGSSWYQDRVYDAGLVREELRDPDVAYFFIDCHGSRVGYAKVNRGQDLPDDADGFEIGRIYLSAESTGRGIGRRVMGQFEGMARAAGRRYLWLSVMESQARAVDFYRALGFSQVGARELPFPLLKPGFRRILQMRKAVGKAP